MIWDLSLSTIYTLMCFENLLLNTLGQNVVLLFEIIETGVLILIQAKTSMKIDILIAKKKTQPSHGITYIYI